MTAKYLFLATLFLATPAMANPRCFSVTQMNGWKSQDARTIYIRANGNEYYRLDLTRECSALKSIDPHLVLTSHGSNMICSAVDLNVKAADAPGGIAEPCFPKTLTAQSPAEAAALPKGAKP